MAKLPFSLVTRVNQLILLALLLSHILNYSWKCNLLSLCLDIGKSEVLKSNSNNSWTVSLTVCVCVCVYVLQLNIHYQIWTLTEGNPWPFSLHIMWLICFSWPSVTFRVLAPFFQNSFGPGALWHPLAALCFCISFSFFPSSPSPFAFSIILFYFTLY